MGRGTLGKRKYRVDAVSKECFQMIRAENRHCSVSQIMISDRFDYRNRNIEFYGALTCLDYYLSLNLGCNIAFL